MSHEDQPGAVDWERLFHEIVDGTDDLVTQVDVQARFTYVNATAEKVFGVPPEVCIGLSAFAFVHPEDREATKEAFQSWLIDRKSSITHENRQVSRDGSVRRMLWTINPSLDSNGEVVHVNSIARDITDLRRAEAALRGFEINHRTFVDSSPLGIHLYKLEPDGRLVFTGANPAADEILGIDNTQFVGKTIEEAFPPLVETEIPEQYRQVCATGKPWRTEQVDYDDWTIRGAYEVFAFRIAPGRMAAQFRDITEQKNAEELLRRRYEFERVITDISTRMISLPTSLIDIEIERVLEEICRFAHADAAHVFLRTPAGGSVKLTHVWHNENLDYSHYDQKPLDLSSFQWTVDLLFIQQEPVVVRWVEDLQEEAISEKRLNLEAGVKAYVSVPLTFEGEVIGFLGFDTVEGPRDWDPTEITLLQNVGQTITNALQRKLAEARLQEREAEYRNLFENAMVAIFRSRPEDGKILAINRIGAHMAGYESAEQLLTEGVSLADFYPPEMREVFLRRLYSEGEISDHEIHAHLPDGTERDLTFWARLDEGRKYVEGVIVDITDRKLAEARLRESEEDYRNLFETALVGISRTRTSDGKVLSINRTGARMAGFDSPEQLLSEGVSLADFYPPESRTEVLRQLTEQGEISNFETHFTPPNGPERDFALWGRLNKDRDHIDGVAVDITDRKQAEAELSKLNLELERRVEERTAELEAANKELESFAYSVSHDLRAPLRAVSGFSQVLMEDCEGQLSKRGLDSVRRIRGGALRMAGMIDGILALSRTTRAEMNLCRLDLSVLASVVLEELRGTDTNRVVEIALKTGLDAYGDPSMLRLVLQNLLGNAWKFTSGREGARIEFFEEKPPNDPEMTVPHQIFCVRDNGVGFDMKNAEDLFSPFRRLHNVDEFPGTGIGLATVQRIVHRHGGRVWAKGEVDRGAAFYFSLPQKAR